MRAFDKGSACLGKTTLQLRKNADLTFSLQALDGWSYILLWVVYDPCPWDWFMPEPHQLLNG